MANSGSSATQVMATFGPATRTTSGVAIQYFAGDSRNNSNCFFTANRRFNFINGNHLIRGRHSLHTDTNRRKIILKSTTRSYKRKNGKWKRHRADINAGIYGRVFTDCFGPTYIVGGSSSIKKRRRRSKTIEISIPENSTGSTFYNTLYSTHRQHRKSHYMYYRD